MFASCPAALASWVDASTEGIVASGTVVSSAAIASAKDSALPPASRTWTAFVSDTAGMSPTPRSQVQPVPNTIAHATKSGRSARKHSLASLRHIASSPRFMP
jgi:hypothetical protein